MNYSQQNKTFFLFEATSIAASSIKGNYKYGAKKFFNLWWNTGVNLWRELMYNMKKKEFGDAAEEHYDDTSAFIYDVVDKSLQVEPEFRDEYLKKLEQLTLEYTLQEC